jgi:hypothetical protein
MEGPVCTSVLLEVVLPISFCFFPVGRLLNGFVVLVEVGAGSCVRLWSYWWCRLTKRGVIVNLLTLDGWRMGTGSPGHVVVEVLRPYGNGRGLSELECMMRVDGRHAEIQSDSCALSMTTTNNQEDPPPYTPTPAFAAGESTVEHGPPRPFQPTAPAQSTVPASSPWPRLQHHVLANTTTRSPLLRQLTDSFNTLVNQLDRPTQNNTWPAYPEQRQASVRPPNHLDPYSLSSPHTPPVPGSSDFYAAGTAIQPEFAPPPGPPPTRQAESFPNSIPDGRPTTYPANGHPLLNDGKVLVYPKGYKCDKCVFVFVSNQSSIY